jgi:hypothetical protein
MKLTLTRDITAVDLAMDALSEGIEDAEGYPPDHVIGAKGTTVEVVDEDGEWIEVTGFSGDAFATGWIPLAATK